MIKAVKFSENYFIRAYQQCGTGVGIYATANGIPSNTKASFDWFEYNGDDD